MNVDHAPGEPSQEVGTHQLHVAGEHDQLSLLLAQPVGHRQVALVAVPVRAERERGAGNTRGAGSFQRLSARVVRRDRNDVHAVAPVRVVQHGLQVGSSARRENRNPHAALSLGNRPPGERSVPACNSSSTRPSTSAARRCAYAPYPGSPSYECSAITFERPPRRISTARVRPTGGRAVWTTSRIASSSGGPGIVGADLERCSDPLRRWRTAPPTLAEPTAGVAGKTPGSHTSQ